MINFRIIDLKKISGAAVLVTALFTSSGLCADDEDVEAQQTEISTMLQQKYDDVHDHITYSGMVNAAYTYVTAAKPATRLAYALSFGIWEHYGADPKMVPLMIPRAYGIDLLFDLASGFWYRISMPRIFYLDEAEFKKQALDLADNELDETDMHKFTAFARQHFCAEYPNNQHAEYIYAEDKFRISNITDWLTKPIDSARRLTRRISLIRSDAPADIYAKSYKNIVMDENFNDMSNNT